MPVLADTTTNGPELASGHLPGMAEVAWEERLRALAIELHAVVFAVAIPLLSVLWVLTEYYEEHTWPSRFASDPDVAGTWDPWLFFVAGIWLIVLAVHALRTYFGPPNGPVGRYIRRPVTQAELEREVERLKSRP